MSTLIVENGIAFHYTDSGRPTATDSDYLTVFIIHGHSFNSGTFRKISSLAPSRSLRVIAIDRREYNGSTPHTLEELHVINHGTYDERAAYIAEQGLLLALLIDGLIQNLSLPMKGGGGISGWSLGNLQALAVINAIDNPKLPPESRERLKAFLHTYIIWEIPSQIFGIDSPPDFYFPFWNYDLPIEERGAVFGTYVSSCFEHSADVLASRDILRLNHRNPTPGTSTIDKMTKDEILSITNFLVGPKCDTVVLEPPFYELHRANLQKALLDGDSSVNKWGMKVRHIYGDKCSWNVILAAWVLEEKDLQANKAVQFKVIEGTNHFLMWEDPERAITVLKECLL